MDLKTESQYRHELAACWKMIEADKEYQRKLEEKITVLAEQNEKMRKALTAMVVEARARNCGLKIADDVLSLPDLASPILNRIRADELEKS